MGARDGDANSVSVDGGKRDMTGLIEVDAAAGVGSGGSKSKALPVCLDYLTSDISLLVLSVDSTAQKKHKATKFKDFEITPLDGYKNENFVIHESLLGVPD